MSDEQITREALIEYAAQRGAFHPEGMLAGALAYVRERYAEQSPEWRARKAPEVLERVRRAIDLSGGV